MGNEEGFWAARSSFRPLIPEVHLGADLLSASADAMLKGDMAEAAYLGRQANIPALWEFAHSIMGPTNAQIHRWRRVEMPNFDAATRAPQRMPSDKTKLEIHARDGWRCRFCGCRVIAKQARSVMCRELPDVFCWIGPDRQRHAAFYALSASADHVVPHSKGGSNDPYNLVTTCSPCNNGRNHWLIEEVGLSDPRDRRPIVNDWDGLFRLVELRS